jgi:opacity protein-like surface antigen
MKKSILTLAAVALLVTSINAQDSVKPVRLGLSVSPNMGWISTDEKDVESDGTRTGFRFGLIGDFRMGSDNYFFSSGLLMNSIGAKIKSGADTSAVTVEAKYQVVEIPITVKLKTAEIGYMTYFGQIGFDTGFRVAAKAKVEDGDWEDASENANILRVALSVGGGLEYTFSGNTSALLGVRYSNGFTSINDGDGAEAKLHYFEVTVGALF